MVLKNLIGASSLAVLSCFWCISEWSTAINETIPIHNGFAVLELFTSEGCSSCPPADELMGEIENQYKNEPVYVLAYHVDYWNNLGWKDQFSKPEYSQKQQEYSRTLRSQVYTPQLVVNGKKEFVGSNRNAVEQAIQTALLSSNNSKIDLSAEVVGDEINVNFKTQGKNSSRELLITLVEKKSESNVKRGENEGRHLVHWQIVHQQNRISLENSAEGKTSFKLPANFNNNDWEIIGMIQNVKSGEIFGAAKAGL